MKLSELKTGESGVIVKVLGHGSFRKRIIEMGFIRGKRVDVLLNAPLQDPVKYRVMGYEVSLRHDEAERVEVLPSPTATPQNGEKGEILSPILQEEEVREEFRRSRRTINVAIVGNPNCGKTSLFNWASGAHARVGNYSGVTVDATVAKAHFEGYEFNLIDLPGTYSLTAYSPEEMYVRRHIIDNTPDVIINVIDAANLERNLYLTTQLIDINQRMVCALNMFDEFEARGDKLDIDTLSTLFGVPMIPTSFKTGRGVELLFHVIINMYEGADYIGADGRINPEVARDIKQWHDDHEAGVPHVHPEDFATGDKPEHNFYRHIHVNHGVHIERGIDLVKNAIQSGDREVRSRYSTRYLAIKLLENDPEAAKIAASLNNASTVADCIKEARAGIEEDTEQDCETAIMDAKYGFIRGALEEAGYAMGNARDNYRTSHAIDYALSNRYIGFPLFFLVMYVMFYVTFTVGEVPMGWIEDGVAWLGGWVGDSMSEGPLRALLTDGVIGGVGSVIVFLPQILILYAFISFMEDSGYMARAAFIMDKVMHRIGLHGKSFIPLVMGFGCNVPAVMATRTIESRRSRLITMMILPFMSCSARLPIYLMLTGVFFPPEHRATVMISLYIVGIITAGIVSKVYSTFIAKGEDTPFVMELPPYRLPTLKATLRHTWEKGKEYLKKMGGIILVASIIVWALTYFPHTPSLDKREQVEQSYMGMMGKTIEPIFEPQGFNWKLDVSLIAGTGAKEIVASTLGVIYADDDSFEDEGIYGEETVIEQKYTSLRAAMSADGITPVTAYAYLLFVLLYFPCIATIVAIKNELNSWRWAIGVAAYTTALAWVASAVFHQIATMIIS